MNEHRRLKVGVVINSGLESGGGFQYEYMVLGLLKKYHHSNSIVIKYYTNKHKIIPEYSGLGIKITIIKENLFQKLHRVCLSNMIYYYFVKQLNLSYSKVERYLEDDGIDVVYFLSPNVMCRSLIDLPYIFTLWDLGHLEKMEFPEVSQRKLFEQRESLYSSALRKSIAVIVDSTYGKNYAVKRYNLDEDRVSVLKYLPNIITTDNHESVNIKEKYDLKNEYIFYPAQFWAHKNHIYILEAVKILKDKYNTNIDVIFSGSDKGTLEYVMNKSQEYHIDELVHYIGFAHNCEMPSLYKQSLSLVMPTHLGPTNIPPLEAFAYKVPVCYSDLPYFREQTGEGAFYFDLSSPESLAMILLLILNNDERVSQKIKYGTQVLNGWDDKQFYDTLVCILSKFQDLRGRWE